VLGLSISKNSAILGGFAIITAGILASTFFVTKDKIAAAERLAAEKALLDIIPRARHDNDMLSDTWVIPPEGLASLGLEHDAVIHIAKQSGNPVAVIIPSVAPDGYSGAIKLIVGVNIDGSIAGVRTLTHKETPGLGDKIDISKDTWVLNFNGKSLTAPDIVDWKVKKDGGEFDQFTGATITPRAFVKRVKQTLEYYHTHRAEIIDAGDTVSLTQD